MKINAAVIALLSCALMVDGEPTPISLLEADCGVSISGSSSQNSKIVNGWPADMFGNPWMALISSSVTCGGSLITNRFVLSAAHCRTNSHTVVYLGEFDRSTTTDCSNAGCMPNAIGIPVDAQIAHPSYIHLSQNDIALFRLATPVQYTAYIQPICLLTNYNPLNSIRHLTATGWGKTEFGLPSSILRTATLTQVDRSYCSGIYGNRVDMSHICAGDYNSHTCMGDSGGPISAVITINGRIRVAQFGIVSYGDSECRELGVYTNVMHHMNWIASVVRHGGPQVTQRPNYYYIQWYYI
ncbi:serine protease grass-like [Drosophila eugracilis]|uniref:serine protease grass-like n=1 Tax=Drosophila eugracilis TaxID=29029 RepID=UPI0007E89CBF|nr:serine protease grass-like [Drosophila eugracilis]